MSKTTHKKSALKYILLGLVPYSRPNLQLSFHPQRFFRELEQTSGYTYSTLRTAYARGKRRGLIAVRRQKPTLTSKGLRVVKPFIAKKLRGAELMVIFDIPERHASLRQQLRLLLKEWNFRQVQKSVWTTEYDYKDTLLEIITEQKLNAYVQLYEAARIKPSP